MIVLHYISVQLMVVHQVFPELAMQVLVALDMACTIVTPNFCKII